MLQFIYCSVNFANHEEPSLLSSELYIMIGWYYELKIQSKIRW